MGQRLLGLSLACLLPFAACGDDGDGALSSEDVGDLDAGAALCRRLPGDDVAAATGLDVTETEPSIWFPSFDGRSVRVPGCLYGGGARGIAAVHVYDGPLDAREVYADLLQGAARAADLAGTGDDAFSSRSDHHVVVRIDDRLLFARSSGSIDVDQKVLRDLAVAAVEALG